MSSTEENVFARWSRRKLSARSPEVPAHDAAPPQETTAKAPAADPHDQGQAPDTRQSEANEPLPRIEDLTAECDLSAFLRDGIPQALKSAAMRKMWSLDPGIRDYVGPAEYAWDFNKAGSMAGFGPVDPKNAVVDFLSKITPDLPPGEDEPIAAWPGLDPEPMRPGDHDIAVPNPAPSAEASDSTAAILQGSDQTKIPVDTHPAPRDETCAASAPSDAAERRQSPVPKSRHGGALPR